MVCARGDLRRWRHYWTTYEWHPWPFYRDHLLHLRSRDRWRNDKLFVLRVQLIISSAATSALLLWPNALYDSATGYHYLKLLIAEDTLGALFGVHAFGMVWRLFAVRVQYAWTAIFASIGLAMYFGVPICVYLDLGRLTIAGVSMMVLGAGCWLLLARGPQTKEEPA